MGLTAEQVIVQVEARMAKLRAEVAQSTSVWERNMARIRGSAGATEARIASASRNMATSLGLVLGAAGITAGIGAFLRLADAAKTIEAQLRLATAASGSFGRAQDDVRRIAGETRTSLEATANLYAIFQRTARELGITQEQAARATQTVSETFLISGATAQEAAGGLRQFIQGVQSGVLRGEEFNSVMENAPRLARLLADSLGVTIGQLRALSVEGRLTGDRLITALTDRRFTAQLDAEFRELPVTIGQALQLVENAAIITFGAFDRGGRFSQWLANFAGESSATFASVERDAELAGANIRAIFDGLGNLFDPIAANAEGVFGYISRLADSAATDIRALTRAWDDVSTNYRQLGFIPTVQIRQRMAADPNYRPPPGFQDSAPRFESARQQSFNANTQNAGIIAAAREQLRPRQSPLPPRAPTAPRRGRGRSGEDPESVARRTAAEEQRFADELAQLNGDLLAARRSMASSAEILEGLERQRIQSERDRDVQAYQAAVKQTRGDRELAQQRADQLIRAREGVAAQEEMVLDQRISLRQAEEQSALALANVDALAASLQIEEQLADTNGARRRVMERLLDAELERLRLELEAIPIHQAADRALAQARLDAAQAMRGGRSELIRRQTLSPREAYLRDLSVASENMGEAFDRVAIDGLQRLNDELAQSVAGFLKLGGIAGAVLNDIVAGILRIAIQQQIVRPLANALFGGGGLGRSGLGPLSLDAAGHRFAGSALAFGGGRAMGGPVSPGHWYNVGERGPELFVPDSPGTIVPQGKALSGVPSRAVAAGGGGPVSITVNVNARDAVLTHTVRSWVAEGVAVAIDQGAARGAMATERSFARRGRQALP